MLAWSLVVVLAQMVPIVPDDVPPAEEGLGAEEPEPAVSEPFEPPSEPALAPAIAPAAAVVEAPAVVEADAGLLSSLSSMIKIYGFLRVDVDVDDSRANHPNVIGFILSEDPDAPDGIRAERNDGSFSMHPKLSRLGLAFDAGEIAGLGAKVSGKMEVDFYNATASASRSALRMRVAYARLDWPQFSVLAGQDWDTISPLNPSPNHDMMMWGAGNLADRRPQVRSEWTGGPLKVAGSVGLTGAVDNQDLDGDGRLDGEASGLPTLQGRVGASVPGWAPATKLEGGIWGHRAWERVTMPIAGREEFDSFAVGLDVKVPIVPSLWVMGEAWMGKNLTDVRGGIFQGVNVMTGEEIRARGGWAELGVKALDWWTPSVGVSIDSPSQGDLEDGQRTFNRVFYAANRLDWSPIQIGLDYLYWETRYKGFGKGTNNRVNVFILYKY